MPECFETYLNTAGEQIRWKRARPALLAELRTHLLDQRDACLEAGMTEEESQAEALRQMGDPVAIGQSLDSVHRPKPQWGLLALTLALVVTGAALRVNLTQGWMAEVSIQRTMCSLLLGTALLFGCYFLDHMVLGRHGKAIYLVALAAGMLLLVWEPLPTSGTFYAAHMIYLFPLIYGVWAYSWRGAGWKGYLLSVLGLGPLVVVAFDMVYTAEGLILAAVGLVLVALLAWQDWYGVGKGPSRGVLLSGCGVMALVAGVTVCTSDYAWYRWETALHPEADPLGAGYGAMTVRAVLEGAQWTGTGMWGRGVSYEESVPGRMSDFLLTTVIHKLGWAPFFLLTLAFLSLTAWLLVKAMGQKNTLGRVVVLSVALPLLLRGLCALAMNLGFLLFGVSFPLMTGNVVMMADMALIGFALSVFRQENLPFRETPVPSPPSRRLGITRLPGSLTITWDES